MGAAATCVGVIVPGVFAGLLNVHLTPLLCRSVLCSFVVYLLFSSNLIATERARKPGNRCEVWVYGQYPSYPPRLPYYYLQLQQEHYRRPRPIASELPSFPSLFAPCSLDHPRNIYLPSVSFTSPPAPWGSLSAGSSAASLGNARCVF